MTKDIGSSVIPFNFEIAIILSNPSVKNVDDLDPAPVKINPAGQFLPAISRVTFNPNMHASCPSVKGCHETIRQLRSAYPKTQSVVEFAIGEQSAVKRDLGAVQNYMVIDPGCPGRPPCGSCRVRPSCHLRPG